MSDDVAAASTTPLLSMPVKRRMRAGTIAAHGALLMGALIFSGFNVVLSDCLKNGLSPLTFAASREAAALIVMYAWAATVESPLRMPAREHHLQFMALGVLLGGFQLLFACGVALTDADTAALFQCVEPTTAAVLAVVLRLERLTPNKMLSALFAGGGVLLIQLTSSANSPANASDDGQHSPLGGARQLLGCALLFGQGVGIAGFCLVQRHLVRVPAAPGQSLQPISSEIGADNTYGPYAVVGPESPATLPSPTSRYGPVTVTAHAYSTSLFVLLLAAAIDAAAGIESPPPLSASSLQDLLSPVCAGGVAYAVVLTSFVGYSLRAWAARTLDASVLVLYNAAQPPITALLGLAIDPTREYRWVEAVGTLLVLVALLLSSGIVAMPWPPCELGSARAHATQEENTASPEGEVIDTCRGPSSSCKQ